MNKNILMFIYALICIFCSCTKAPTKKHTFLLFNLYNNTDSIVNKKVFELTRFPLNKIDSIVIYNKKSYICNYKEKVVREKGIYRSCGKNLILTHSFSDTSNSSKFCLMEEPFINESVLLIDSKKYKIKGVEYKLYYYAENNGSHSGYSSYYLEDVGFICYYNFSRDDYILCDSTNIKTLNIKGITNQLIRDTAFFARFIGKKLIPNYYRSKTQYNKN